MDHNGREISGEALLSKVEAARVLGISEPGVKRLIARGELASVKIGRRRLLEPSALRAFIASRREIREPARSP